MSNGAIALSLRGQSARGFILEASADLQHWEGISTNASPVPAISPLDASATNVDHKFYRTRALQ
jgi:hypothetical protein